MLEIPTKCVSGDFSLPVLGLGTWKMAGEHRRDPDADIDRAQYAIKYAISRWMKHIDTAEMYGMWQTEEMLGWVLHEFDRGELCITSKVIGKLASYDAIHSAVENTLQRLGTDYLDLYLIHWRDPLFTIEEQMRAMNELYESGKIRHIGVSNFSKESLEQAKKHCRYPIVLNQVHYNLIYRWIETTWLLDYCQQNNVLVQAYRPVQYGEMTVDTSPIMQEICQKYNASPAQVAMNWLIAQKNVVTLFMSTNPHHIDENLGTLDWEMAQWDVERLREEFPGQIDSTHVPLG